VYKVQIKYRALSFLLLASPLWAAGLEGRLQFGSYEVGKQMEVEVSLKNYGNSAVNIFPENLIVRNLMLYLEDEYGNPVTLSAAARERLGVVFAGFEQRLAGEARDLVRKIVLSPGEGMSFSFKMEAWYVLHKPGRYYLRGEFFPEGNYDKNRPSIILPSVPLDAIPHEDFVPWEDLKSPKLVETKEKIYGRLYPQEILHGHLRGREKGDFETFSAYLHLASLITQQGLARPALLESYLGGDPQIRDRALQNFARDLFDGRPEKEVLDIEEKSIHIENNRATAVIDLTLREKGGIFVYRNTYKLTPTGDDWWITGLGSEILERTGTPEILK